MLEAAGIGPDEERAYRLLVGTFDGCPESLAAKLDLTVGETAKLLESLHAKGLVSRVAGPDERYEPMPPDVGFGPLLLRGQESLEWARNAVFQLAEEYRSSARRRDASQLVEVVTGAAPLRQQIRNLQRSARHEIVWFCKAGHVAMPSSDNDEELEMLSRGVRYRVIYERALLEEPGMIASAAMSIGRGEVARATSTLPVRLAIADGSLALCPLVPAADGLGEPTAALIRQSSLLDALIALFESHWERSSPLQLTGSGGQPAEVGPDSDELYLLSLLVAGVADKAIASQLGLSLRTVQRRVHDLMVKAGADTRTQLAWHAAKLNWLPGDVEIPRSAPTS
jgi:hypothetical protein